MRRPTRSLLPLLTLILPALSQALDETTYFAYRSPSPLPLPPLSSLLFSSPPCRERGLAFPEAPVVGGILVLSLPPAEWEDVKGSGKVEGMGIGEGVGEEEEEEGKEGEEEVGRALWERRGCGVEVKVVELEDVRELLDPTSYLTLTLLPTFSYTILTSLSPASLELLAPSSTLETEASSSRLDAESEKPKGARLKALLKSTTQGWLSVVIFGIWGIGIACIARRLWLNRARAEGKEEVREEKEWNWDAPSPGMELGTGEREEMLGKWGEGEAASLE